MKRTHKLLGFAIMSLLFISCKKDKFNTHDSEFQTIYSNVIDSGDKQETTMDNEVHSYTFTLSEDRQLKSIGYESLNAMKNTDYLFEIRNNTDSSIVYSGNHQFKSSKISYVSPHTTVNLSAGVSYTVQRVQINWGDDIGHTIGKIVFMQSSAFPLTSGIMTITSGSCHDYGDTSNLPTTSQPLPRIDLVFE